MLALCIGICVYNLNIVTETFQKILACIGKKKYGYKWGILFDHSCARTNVITKCTLFVTLTETL